MSINWGNFFLVAWMVALTLALFAIASLGRREGQRLNRLRRFVLDALHELGYNPSAVNRKPRPDLFQADVVPDFLGRPVPTPGQSIHGTADPWFQPSHPGHVHTAKGHVDQDDPTWDTDPDKKRLVDAAVEAQEKRDEYMFQAQQAKEETQRAKDEVKQIRGRAVELAKAIKRHHDRVAEVIEGKEPFGDPADADADEFTLADRELYDTFAEATGNRLDPLPEPPPEQRTLVDKIEELPEAAPTTVQVVPPPLPPESIPGSAPIADASAVAAAQAQAAEFEQPPGQFVTPQGTVAEHRPPAPVAPPPEPAAPVTFQPPVDPSAGVSQPVAPPAPARRPNVELPPRPGGTGAEGPGALSHQMAAVNGANPDAIPYDPDEPPPTPGAGRPPRRIERQATEAAARSAAGGDDGIRHGVQPQRPAGISDALIAGLPPEKRAEVEGFLADQ